MGNMPHGHAPLVGFDRPKPGPCFACTSLPKGDVKVENKTRNEETRRELGGKHFQIVTKRDGWLMLIVNMFVSRNFTLQCRVYAAMKIRKNLCVGTLKLIFGFKNILHVNQKQTQLSHFVALVVKFHCHMHIKPQSFLTIFLIH
uniref:Uncharacterized protein n=1 Tax=Salix viminalis TaxID=40686 RepID=A0A6N2LEA8_SALVM